MAWHFLSYIPRGQNWAFREMGKMGVLLSPYLPVALSPLLCMLPKASFREDPDCKFRARAVIVHPGLHLVSTLLSFAGLGGSSKAKEPCWRGEEFYFSEGLSGTSPCCFVTFLREHPETSFIGVYRHPLYKAVVKRPLLGSWLSDK